MDIEFHYYMTYLIAARAGFAPAEAEIIARAAQSVDDNHIRYRIAGGPDGDYCNYMSQTMDILKPARQLLRIYPIFHFIPGDPNAPTSARLDGVKNDWVTTPDSPVAGKMMGSALGSGDLYRIGVSAHGYVDTWAHENFVGRRDEFNDIPGASWVTTLLNVGHGSAGHQPDQPGLVWTDPRLVNGAIENRHRFLDAAEALFRRLARHRTPDRSEAAWSAEVVALRQDLDADIGPIDPSGSQALRAARIARYRQRALSPGYGRAALGNYDEYGWFNAAVAEEGAWLRQHLDGVLDVADDYIDQTTTLPCKWRDPANFQQSDWFRFAEAVKDHQNACWAILVSENLPGLDGPNM